MESREFQNRKLQIEDPDLGKELVMIVDDDAVNRKLVSRLLEDQYEIITASSGSEAFSLLNRYRPSVILLDVFMPEETGISVIRKLKANERFADIPVIFLTGDDNRDTEVQGFHEGAEDFLRKPFHQSVAIQRIQRIIEIHYLKKNMEQEIQLQTQVAEERRRRVERMSLQMVQALASTIDAKDTYTKGHSSRVAKYSVMIAKKLGYEGIRLVQLRYAALLHDIGKIGIPNEIINKPTKLTEEEYEVIKKHPVIGANILKEITEIPDIAIGARWHHERYDGKGYPDQISGIGIPEIARIIGVADAYDAMTSKRSYRNILPQQIVLEEIKKGRGTQFDPQVADAMMELILEDVEYDLREEDYEDE